MVRPQGQDQRQHGRTLNVSSSNKQWTEMFKSKSYSRSKYVAFPSVLDESEERNPMPKRRWNPKPEQIRLLEAIFNSGMVNPPKEEISKIRAHLQEYGQVVDSNVYHWFRNRKSRSKQKNHQQNSATRSSISCRPLLAPSSSSSASNMSSSNGVRRGGFLDISKNSSGGSMNQNFNILNYQNNQYLNLRTNQVQMQAPLPNYHPTQQTRAIATIAYGGEKIPYPRVNEIMVGGDGSSGSSQLESFSRMSLNDMSARNSSTTVVTGPRRYFFEDEVQHTLAFMNTNPITTSQTINVPPPASSYQIPPTSQVQGLEGAGMMGPSKSTATVLINGAEVKVSSVLPFYVQEAFGEDMVMFYQSGHPVPTNNRGATLHPLKHGASYFLKRFTPAAAPNLFPFN